MYIQTSRLIIRDYRSSDWQELYEIFSDAQVMAHCEPVYDIARTQDILSYFMQKSCAYAVCLAETGKVIGHILFSQLPPPDAQGIYELGWIFHRLFWGQGYAYEASQAIIDYGFQALGLHKITAETIDPVKAPGLMRKLGMRHEGTFHSHTRNLEGNWTNLYWYGICNPMEVTSL